MSAVDFVGVRLDALDVRRVATFWADLMGWRLTERADGAVIVVPIASSGYPVAVCAASEPKSSQNRIHLDLTTTSASDMRQLIARAHDLGATDVDIGQSPDEPHTVLADPEGNELCVIDPGNRFLDGTGPVGAINCDGTQALGYFWSEALDWPLVWDQDEETAIQSRAGGSKITWSGPPLMPRQGRDRLRLELVTSGPLAEAAAHLESVGARVVSEPSSGEVVLEDPDGNDFHLVSAAIVSHR